MIRGENVYTVRFPFEMRLYVKDSFFSFFANVVPWCTSVSKKNISFSDISAVNFIGGHVSLLVPRRKLRCLVYLCPIGKKCNLCSVFKQLVLRRFCLNFVFQYVP